MSLPTEQHHCCNCGATTAWSKHSSFDQCQGCRTRFPCASKLCGHLDCAEARGEIKECAHCRYLGAHKPGCENAVDFEPQASTIDP